MMTTNQEFPTIESLQEKYENSIALDILNTELKEAGKDLEFRVLTQGNKFQLWAASKNRAQLICTQALLPMVYYIRTSI